MFRSLLSIFLLFILLLPQRLVAVNVSIAAADQPVPQAAINTNKIDELLVLGIPGLALRLIDKQQPVMTQDNLSHWLQWEYIRIRLLQRLEQWDEVINRIDAQLPLLQKNSISTIDINWFKSRLVDAYLQSNQPQKALSMLQQLLWTTDIYVGSDVIALWRRQVIHSYLNQDKVEDAQRAMQRYAQDYGNLPNEDGAQWDILQARLLMRTERVNEAIVKLQQLDWPEAVALLELARLQAGQVSAAALRKQIKNQLQAHAEEPQQLRLDWYLLLQAALKDVNYYQQILALESLLSMNSLQALEPVFDGFRREVSADALWQAYENYGLHIANKRQLLRGDDDTWFNKAGKEKKKTYQARGLYTVLAFNGLEPKMRDQAFEQLVNVLEKHSEGLDLVHRLFMDSQRISDLSIVPRNVRYQLVDYALARADIKIAARIMEKLEQPPQGEDLFVWNLRRARVMILGGQYDEGEALLNSLLKTRDSLQSKEIDPFMQVLFDFQNVQEHRRALQLFEKLQAYPLSPKLQREIIFWRAESMQAMGDYEQAAYLFLISARPLDNIIDPWFHTASFRAAESMEQADLLNDARRQYLKLLRFTANAARKAIIQQRLQQLQLQLNKQPESKKTRVQANQAPIVEATAR
ncbi:MAG: tetratricopeptide repeat protein [Gammaproteobacteria bacterium]